MWVFCFGAPAPEEPDAAGEDEQPAAVKIRDRASRNAAIFFIISSFLVEKFP